MSKTTIPRTFHKKIRSSVKIRQDKGYYFGTKAPYGYVKDENDHHHLIVDEAVRPMVKEVFARYLSGESMLAIAKDLNERKVLTPGKHHRAAKRNGNLDRTDCSVSLNLTNLCLSNR